MSKKYRLKQNLPDVCAGGVFKLSADGMAYFLSSEKTGTGLNCYAYPVEFVENNTEWFEEIKEPERITVLGLYNTGEAKPIDSDRFYQLYQFHLWNKIPQDKLPAIKQAIEEVLNATAWDEISKPWTKYSEAAQESWYHKWQDQVEEIKKLKSQIASMFTQDQVDRIEMAAFFTAREVKSDFYLKLPPNAYIFPDIKSYKNRKAK